VLRQLPNLLTLFRLLSSPLLAWYIIDSHFREALAVVAFAGLTDWLDGFTARRLRVSGNVGVVLDPLADKVMLVTLFVVLAYVGLVQVWLLALVIGRDVVIVTGAFLLRVFRDIRTFMPSVLGKVSTFFQIVFVLLALLCAAEPNRILTSLELVTLILTTLFTTLSGLDYVKIGIQMTKRKQIERKSAQN
jgi:cardiolipin synthase (CMP-forming)